MADGNYAVVATVQTDYVNMTGDASTQTWLTNHKPEVDRKVDDAFTPYVDLIPFVTGATNDLIAIANAWLAAMWFGMNKDFKSASYWQKFGDDLKNDVIARAKALPAENTRTSSLIVGADPRNAKMPLPTQASIFIFDQFA